MRSRLLSWAPPAAILGGLLWIIYAILLMLHPWGDPLRTQASGDATTVADGEPFVTAAVVGALALACLGQALLGTVHRLGLPVQTTGRIGLLLGWASLAAAAAAVVGSVAQQAALTSTALSTGELLLALGVLLVAIDAAAVPASGRSGSALFVVGAAGMLGLIAEALVVTTTWMLPIYAALVMAIYGLAWVRFGDWLSRQNWPSEGKGR